MNQIISKLTIVLAALSLLSQAAYGQKANVGGTVVDDTGAPLPGVLVVEKGNNRNGATTDANGLFELKVDGNAVLELSCLGFKSQEVEVKGKTKLSIEMNQDVESLSEVVVVGFGSVKKSNLTYAVAKMTDEAVKERPVSSMSEAFQGQLSGVRAQAQDGLPGEELTIRIRGNNTINGDSSPLYVIDGVPCDNMTDMSTADIASIQVLKDAAATSIYGARGGNGVILIETKQGDSSKPTITFNGYFGLQTVEKKLDMMSGEEWVAYNVYRKNLQWKRAGGSLKTPIEERGATYSYPSSWFDTSKYTDWQDAIFQVAPIQEYTLSLSEKSKAGNTFASAGYMRQDGVVVGSYYDRINARLNRYFKITPKLIAEIKLNLSNSNQDGAGASGKEAAIQHALCVSPLMKIDEGTKSRGFPENIGMVYPNPYLRLTETTAKTSLFSAGANLKIEYAILKYLKFKTQFAYSYAGKKYEYFQPADVAYSTGYITTGNSNSSTKNKWDWQNTLTFDKQMGRHYLNAVLGHSMNSSKSYYITAAATGWPYENITTLNVATTPTEASTNRVTYNTLSFFGRINYNYAERYLLTASLRYDGSSRFGSNTKWGLFPSVSAGWKISGENWMKDARWLSLLKIRASLGTAGNDRIGDFTYIAKLGKYNTVWNETVVSGLAPSNLANEDLQWERTRSFDVGLDFSAFKNRLQMNVDYYHNITDNLLFNIPVPTTTGYSTYTDNIGSVQNNGWELDLTGHIFQGDFNWSLSGNLSQNWDKVLSMGDVESFTSTVYDGVFITKVGYPVSQYYCYQTDGVLTAEDIANKVPQLEGQREGNPKYVDVNGDGVITTDDYVMQGSNLPDLTYGITNRFSYKGFDLSILVQGQVGGQIVFMGSRQYDNGSGGTNAACNQFSRWLRCYKPDFDALYGADENPIPTEYCKEHGIDMSWDGVTPNVAYGAFSNNDDRRLYDASYLRIKNINFGYSIPSKKLRKSVVKGFRAYLSVENVYTFTDYKGFNVEANDASAGGNFTTRQGIDYSTYPLSRRYTLGVNVSF